MKIIATAWLAGTLSALGGGALAQDPDPATAAVTGSASQVESRLAGAYAAFAGSEDNARSLVTGLRQGSEITLTAAGADGQAGESVTFTPPTRPMGYGNVRISLALAQESLAQNGIAQPTPSQLQAALAGGTIATGTGEPGTTTQLAGVLQMRADGMGWGQIANSMGVKLGHVITGRTAPVTPAAPVAAGAASTAAGSSGGGITTAAGAAPATVRAQGRGNGAGTPPQRAGAGIVTAAGGSAAAGNAGLRHGAARAGVVTGAAAGSRASAAGLAHGKGLARP